MEKLSTKDLCDAVTKSFKQKRQDVLELLEKARPDGISFDELINESCHRWGKDTGHDRVNIESILQGLLKSNHEIWIKASDEEEAAPMFIGQQPTGKLWLAKTEDLEKKAGLEDDLKLSASRVGTSWVLAKDLTMNPLGQPVEAGSKEAAVFFPKGYEWVVKEDKGEDDDSYEDPVLVKAEGAPVDSWDWFINEDILKEYFLPKEECCKFSEVAKREDGYYVLSKAGKNLGGPYATKTEANKRLQQVEYFKNKAAAKDKPDKKDENDRCNPEFEEKEEGLPEQEPYEGRKPNRKLLKAESLSDAELYAEFCSLPSKVAQGSLTQEEVGRYRLQLAADMKKRKLFQAVSLTTTNSRSVNDPRLQPGA